MSTEAKSRDKSPFSGNEKLRNLVRKRGIIKGRLTKFANHISSLDNVLLADQKQIDLKLRIKGATSLFEEFNDVQTQIEESVSEAQSDEQLTQRELFEDSYYSILSQAEYIINKNLVDSSKCNHKLNTIKLPTISMPTFDGSYEQWLEYRDTFLALVHHSDSLSHIEKYHYLKSSLKGSAELVINSLEFSSDNYLIAWELLLNRYNNNRLLVHSHVKSLFTMSTISKESPVFIKRLIDTVLKNLRALKVLGEPTESWDTLVIYLIVSKLDQTTEREWEQCKGTLISSNSEPNTRIRVDDLILFLKNRADMLETLQLSHSKISHVTQTDNKRHSAQNKVHCNVSSNKHQERNRALTKRVCLFCKASHPLYSCQQFIDSTLELKLKFISDNKLCINCLRVGHTIDTCRFGPCRMCNQKHHSLVHPNTANVTNQSVTLHASQSSTEMSSAAATTTHPPPVTSEPVGTASSLSLQIPTMHANKAHINKSVDMKPVLLSTALIEIMDSFNNYHVVRAILDSGSERCFITKSLCDLLQTPIIQSTHEIRGVGNSVTQSTQSCSVKIKSRTSFNYITQLKCFVLPNITSALPMMPFKVTQFNIPDDVQLADPQFYESKHIDILIGADKFWDLMEDGRCRLPTGSYLQNTKLGWIVSGTVHSTQQNTQVTRCHFTQSLDNLMRSFWELEEKPISSSSDSLSNEERECEDHFVRTTTRESNGRFCVQIPFKESPESLGKSYYVAEKRFYALEKRLQRNKNYNTLYTEFINEYIRLGHMTRIPNYNSPHYFMPHHGVFREHSTTTKLRVVFDASAQSSNGKSLNSLQLIGPPIQGDLISILLRFRENRYVACADIEKMYRQILVDERQRHLQLILWREKPCDPLGVYQLNTVTYGTASAPFLSCRCLKQLAQECSDATVARVINEDLYVDDAVFGAPDIPELMRLCNETDRVLKSGCFKLRKWIFNFNVPSTDNISKELSLGEHTNSKTLGLGWYNRDDYFYFHTRIENKSGIVTKRTLFSDTAQIFDPLGLLSPIITTAKILIQRLWLLKLDWDEPAPHDITQTWIRFVNDLTLLNKIHIPRYVMSNNYTRIELHIFTDASQAAYGASAYVRAIGDDSTVHVKLLFAKGKVAPVASPFTIPRLELCGALVGARLYDKIIKSLRCQFNAVMFWTDSTIVLGWLRMPPSCLKTYVQNRIAQIHSLTRPHSWNHVGGNHNPADLVSRGASLASLYNSSLWWEGPQFLHEFDFSSTHEQPHNLNIPENLPEIKSIQYVNSLLSSDFTNSYFPFTRFSQFNRMRRAGAYVLRFIYNARNKDSTRTGPLSVVELNESGLMLIRLSQLESFPEEYKILVSNCSLKGKHNLSKFNLFLDSNKIIRVGGRIEYSSCFSFDKKHPCLISSKHWFTELLFRFEHKQLQHAGPLALLYNIRESYWPLGGRNLARRIVQRCIICTRLKGKTPVPIMGNLPKERITPTFPFLHCGVDYAGPVLVLNRKGRGSRLTKAYICLFVCFVTRAVHLELVTDLSSDAYLLALKRLIARRGKPAEIVSDNGRNFIGVANEFTKFLSNCSRDIIEYATSQDIKFSFIPPYAPHFGGLWEAGVKSCKHHLLRVVGNAHLTFEEFSTVLYQIEAILNSRPMSPMSSDPTDFTPLSPAHFLVGRLLTAPASEELTDVPVHRLTRYQRLEQLRQHYWNRWTKEYISELQVRAKWRENKSDLQPNTLVVVKEDHTPPLKWSLGRIISTIPGKDGVARVAEIQTKAGVIKRAFSRICPLFAEDD